MLAPAATYPDPSAVLRQKAVWRLVAALVVSLATVLVLGVAPVHARPVEPASPLIGRALPRAAATTKSAEEKGTAGADKPEHKAAGGSDAASTEPKKKEATKTENTVKKEEPRPSEVKASEPKANNAQPFAFAADESESSKPGTAETGPLEPREPVAKFSRATESGAGAAKDAGLKKAEAESRSTTAQQSRGSANDTTVTGSVSTNKLDGATSTSSSPQNGEPEPSKARPGGKEATEYGPSKSGSKLPETTKAEPKKGGQTLEIKSEPRKSKPIDLKSGDLEAAPSESRNQVHPLKGGPQSDVAAQAPHGPKPHDFTAHGTNPDTEQGSEWTEPESQSGELKTHGPKPEKLKEHGWDVAQRGRPEWAGPSEGDLPPGRKLGHLDAETGEQDKPRTPKVRRGDAWWEDPATETVTTQTSLQTTGTATTETQPSTSSTTMDTGPAPEPTSTQSVASDGQPATTEGQLEASPLEPSPAATQTYDPTVTPQPTSAQPVPTAAAPIHESAAMSGGMVSPVEGVVRPGTVPAGDRLRSAAPSAPSGSEREEQPGSSGGHSGVPAVARAAPVRSPDLDPASQAILAEVVQPRVTVRELDDEHAILMPTSAPETGWMPSTSAIAPAGPAENALAARGVHRAALEQASTVAAAWGLQLASSDTRLRETVIRVGTPSSPEPHGGSAPTGPLPAGAPGMPSGSVVITNFTSGDASRSAAVLLALCGAFFLLGWRRLLRQSFAIPSGLVLASPVPPG